jgi:hypothetical protein
MPNKGKKKVSTLTKTFKEGEREDEKCASVATLLHRLMGGVPGYLVLESHMMGYSV